MTVYSYEQIKQIKQSMTYVLPDGQYQHLKKILGNSGYTLSASFITSSASSCKSSSGFQNYSQPKKKNNKARECVDNSEWDRAVPANVYPEFKGTTLSITSATGITSVLGNIKLLLNKLNREKYDDISQQIKTEMEQSLTSSTVRAMNDLIMSVVASNDFHSEVYARLYTALLDDFPDQFDDLFNDYIDEFLNNFDFETCPDSDTNYDEYCNYVSRMKRRIAVATFIKHMVLNGVIEKFKITNYLDDMIQTVIQPNLDSAEHMPMNEDAIKLMAVFYKRDIITETTTNVQSTLTKWSKFVMREHAGLGSKGIFALKEMVAKF
jgi:hypothetical protein